MNVLIIYFSQTGNTEKIANAIFQEVSQANKTDIKKLDAVDSGSLADYDFIFIGSPIHAGSIAKEVAQFLENIPESANTKLAGFVTHAAPAYPKQSMDDMAGPFENTCKAKGLDYKGCFNCQGYLADFMHEVVQKMRKVDDATWAENVKQMTGHPNDEDIEHARKFAKSVL